jgi:hypothetical protein
MFLTVSRVGLASALVGDNGMDIFTWRSRSKKYRLERDDCKTSTFFYSNDILKVGTLQDPGYK